MPQSAQRAACCLIASGVSGISISVKILDALLDRAIADLCRLCQEILWF
jgi:hypothetical protein